MQYPLVLSTIGILIGSLSACSGSIEGAAETAHGAVGGTIDAGDRVGSGGGATTTTGSTTSSTTVTGTGGGSGGAATTTAGGGSGGGATTSTTIGSGGGATTSTGSTTSSTTVTGAGGAGGGATTITGSTTSSTTVTGAGGAGGGPGVPPPVGCDPGANKTYDVGDGKPYAKLGAVPWSTLGPGDTVRIFPKPGGYHEKFILSTRGADGAPIRVCGVAAADGSRPVIDGKDATTDAKAAFGGYMPLQDLGLITIARGAQAYGFRPGWIVIEGLVIQGANGGNTYTATTGAVRSYDSFAAGVNLNAGDHVTLRHCELRDDGNGLFSNSKHEVEGTLTREVLVEGNYFHDNGVVGSYSMHDAYTQALGIVYQYNRFGPLRPGAAGAALKDRSAGTVVRYNWIEGTVRMIDLVDAQDHAPDALADPRYHQTFVYGNVIISRTGDATRMVHYGGDTGGFEQNFRKGTLYFFGNTVISRHDLGDAWGVSVLYASTNDEAIDARDNVVSHVGSSHLWLMTDLGHLVLGTNWITSGWKDGSDKFAGTVTGAASVVGGADALLDPGTFHPLVGSPVIGTAGALAPEAAPYPVDSQYDGASGTPRPPLGVASDMGAFAGG